MTSAISELWPTLCETCQRRLPHGSDSSCTPQTAARQLNPMLNLQESQDPDTHTDCQPTTCTTQGPSVSHGSPQLHLFSQQASQPVGSRLLLTHLIMSQAPSLTCHHTRQASALCGIQHKLLCMNLAPCCPSPKSCLELRCLAQPFSPAVHGSKLHPTPTITLLPPRLALLSSSSPTQVSLPWQKPLASLTHCSSQQAQAGQQQPHCQLVHLHHSCIT